MSDTRTPDRTLLGAGIVVAILVVAAIIVVLTGEGVVELDPTTPEGVVQQYMNHAIDDDEDEAIALLNVDPNECTHIRAEVTYDRDAIRIVLGDVEIDGDEAEVDVTITRSSGEPLDNYEWTEDLRFELVSVDGAWKIDEAPWPFVVCEERFMP
jgi:hypothetical protein